jgi:hypothetical protein
LKAGVVETRIQRSLQIPPNKSCDMKLFLAHTDHFRMSTTGFDLVDWDVVEMAMKGFPEMF